ncbi:putative ribonuclease H-like domain-containing protein [Tanacetum coccineum]
MLLTQKTTVNAARPMSYISKKAHSIIKRHIHKNTAFKNSNFNERVNTVKDKNVNTVRPKAVVNAARPKAVVNVVKGNNVNVVKASACWVWKPKTKVLDHGNPQMDLQDQGVIDSGCSRHMTGNMSYLTDYEEIDGGYVAFGGNPKGGKITGKGTIKTGNLDFENVYFVRELKFNLFSVSQMCDKKNSVLFNDTECIVLSPNFKLIDESQVLLRVPRKNNMYSVDLKNIVPKGGLTCLFAKATSDESKLWHRRLGKQHRAFCKSKTESSISLPSHLLHVDLFGPTFVKSLKKKIYFLAVIDDYSRFTWVFFLATKDETSGILKSFITGIENLADHKVKVIRCDNGSEFKNREMNQFYEMKGILRQFSIPKTPQKNGVTERKNRTLIEAARTMLADSNLTINDAGINEVNVVCGKTSIKLPFDINMPALEDDSIFDFSRDDEDDGAMADMNNLDTTIQVSPNPTTRIHKDHHLDQVIGDLQSATQTRKMSKTFRGTWKKSLDYDEVFAPVTRIEAIRLFLAYASFKDFVVYQMDVKSDFLYGKIEEDVYVCQPLGFEDPNFPDRVYKVEKALY